MREVGGEIIWYQTLLGPVVKPPVVGIETGNRTELVAAAQKSNERRAAEARTRLLGVMSYDWQGGDDIANKLGMAQPQNALRRLVNLLDQGVVERKVTPSCSGGGKKYFWRLKDECH